MTLPPVIAALDWDSVFYILIPLVYVAAQFFTGDKKKGGSKSAEAKPGSAEAQERLRRVQEEIRRKIAERQAQMNQEQGGPSAPAPAQPASPSRRYDPNLPEWAQRGEAQEAPPRPPPTPVASRPTPPPTPAASRAEDYERRLREQQALLRETQRKREAAFAQTHGAGSRQSRIDSMSIGGIQEPSSSIVEALHSPGAARQAILLREILGPPRALREHGTEF